jgi:hypothetical protein
LNYIHVGTAFNRLGKMAKHRDVSSRHLVHYDAFTGLLRLACGFAENGKFGSQELANTTHGIAKLHDAGRLDVTDGPVDATLAALEIDTVRVAPNMNSQEVANTVYAYGTMGRMPGDVTWAALETAAVRVAPNMNSQEVANLTWAYATLGRMPGDETWAALETAAVRVAPNMNSQEVANLTLAYAKFGRMPGDETWAALETAAVRVAPSMNSQQVANLAWAYSTLVRMPGDETWAALETAAVRVAPNMTSQGVANLTSAYATLGRMSGDETWAALETAAVRVAPSMNSQEVANLTWAYATLGRMPGDETWAALETAAVRVAPNMNSQDVANILWAHSTLSTLRDVNHPPWYATVWDLASTLESRGFPPKGLRMLFHVHLMHQLTTSTRPVKVAYPAWLMVEARDAWMQQVRDDITVSRTHRELASVIGELGVRHEVERVTADGYFSMDIYLPEHDVAVEFDGPTHYYTTGGASSSRDASTTRTAKTELRDVLLVKQCARVVTVPWFEWRDLGKTPKARRAYVKEKLTREADVEL